MDVGLRRRDVDDLSRLLRDADTPKGHMWRRSEQLIAAACLDIRRRRVVSGNCAESVSVTEVHLAENLAAQMRTALASMAWKTDSKSPGELLMTCSTSEVAACCSRASASSRFVVHVHDEIVGEVRPGRLTYHQLGELFGAAEAVRHQPHDPRRFRRRDRSLGEEDHRHLSDHGRHARQAYPGIARADSSAEANGSSCSRSQADNA